jgi:biotin carboxylase
VKYLAILGGNELAVPALERLRDHGHRLLVIDGNPDAPGKSVSDRFLHVNFSDTDRLKPALGGIELTGVMPINDFGVRSAGAIAAERGLPGNSLQTAMATTNKVLMRKAWGMAGLPQPRYCSFLVSSLEHGKKPDWDEYPCIVKPAYSGGGSRGVGLVRSWEEVVDWTRNNRRAFIDDEGLLEEYIQGSEHTAEVLVWPDGMKLLSISDKENYRGNVSVVQNLYFPGPIGHRYGHEMESLLYAACRALYFKAGAAHFEVLIREEKLYLLEVGGRPGGGINLHPICMLSTGYDYPKLYAAILSGEAPEFELTPSHHLAWHYFDHEDGILRAIHGVEALMQDPSVVAWKIYEEMGIQTLDKRNDLARPGFVLIMADTHEAAKKKATMLCSMISFEIEKPS